MRTSVLIVAVFTTAVALARSDEGPQCANVGFADWNVQTSGAYIGRNSDVEGPLKAGSFDVINYSIHGKPSCPGAVSLSTGSGSWTNGQLRAGAGAMENENAVSLTNVNIGSQANAVFANSPFAAAINAQLCGVADTDSVQANSPYPGAHVINTSAGSFAVVSISASSVTQMMINRGSLSQTLVINLRSNSVTFENAMAMIDNNSNANARYVLFNHCGTGLIDIHSYGWFGSLLAPNSPLRFYNAQFEGQAIVESVDGYNGQYGEFHCNNFDGCVCPDGFCPNDPVCETINCDDFDDDACTTHVCDEVVGGCVLDSTETCDNEDNDACTTHTCNSATGACELTNTVDCVDFDDDACTTHVCDDVTGGCVLDSTETCDNEDNDACTTHTCNSVTGACELTNTETCDNEDNDACTTHTCNSVTGACDLTNTETCDNEDNDACTTHTCNSATGACELTDTVDCVDFDDDACTTHTCNSSSGLCQLSDTETCDNEDNDVCTTHTCNSVTGACDLTDTLQCDDGLVCTDNVCDPVDGCTFPPIPGCSECRLEIGDAANFNVFAKMNAIIKDAEGPVGAGVSVAGNSFNILAYCPTCNQQFVCDIGSTSRAMVSAGTASLNNGQVRGSIVVPTDNFFAPNQAKCTGNACNNVVKVDPPTQPNIDPTAICNNLESVNAQLCMLSSMTDNVNKFQVINDVSVGIKGSQDITVPAGWTVVINLHSATGFANGQITVNGQTPSTFTPGHAAGGLLWNVCGTPRDLTMSSMGFSGALLAPFSELDLSNGSVDGQMWVKNYDDNGSAEAHCMKFSGCLCPGTVCNADLGM